jgi:hypothetical protein
VAEFHVFLFPVLETEKKEKNILHVSSSQIFKNSSKNITKTEESKVPQVLRATLPGYRYKLKAAIHGAGFRSQNDFAQTTGIDPAELSRILNGLNPTKPGLRKIADALSMTVFELKQIL